MFWRLKSAFSNLVRTVVEAVKEDALREGDVERALSKLYVELVESDVAVDVADVIVSDLRGRLVGARVPRFGEREAAVRAAIYRALLDALSDVPDVDFYEESRKLLERARPVVVMFLGPNGYGKTTTLAKLAFQLRQMGYSVVAAAADTFRAGAVEQLEEHGKRVGFRVVGGRYGADPAAVAYDAIQHARSRGSHFVLIDTAGRMHTDRNLMEELRKIQRVAEPHFSVFVFDSQLGNDALEIAKQYAAHVRIDGMVAAKADVYQRGGSILTFMYTLRRPIYFLGTGQAYGDLVKFSKSEYLRQLLLEEFAGS
jgi:fused signal recognition particle receptor